MQNHLHFLPEDAGAGAAALEPLVSLVDIESRSVQLLILTPDAEVAARLAEELVSRLDTGDRVPHVLAATDARRAARILRANAPHVIVGSAATLVELSQAAVLKLDNLRGVGLLWIDATTAADAGAVEAIMADMPKDSARVIVASAPSSSLEQLVERYARRARKPTAAGTETRAAVSVSYVTTSLSARRDALRRLLDALAPASAYVVTAPASRQDVELVLRALGYDSPASAVRTGGGDATDENAAVVILYDFPASADDVRRYTSSRVIALVTARQIATLRRFAGGQVTPFTLPEAGARARTRQQVTRDELRAALEKGGYEAELLALEPLLSDYDGIEIAAVTLRLLEAARAKMPVGGGAESPASMTRLFINVGEMDGIRPGDLVGAITSEAGIAREQLGRVEIRERNSTVEVATVVANQVVTRMTGVTIRGRRALVKVDEERGSRPPARGPRPDRPDRGRRDRPARSRPRGQ